MHDASIIILLSIIVHSIIIILFKIKLHAFGDILLDNANVIVPVPRALLMVKAQGVQELMYNGAYTEAAHIEIIVLQIQLLHSLVEPNIRVTATGLGGNVHIIGLITSCLLEGEA